MLQRSGRKERIIVLGTGWGAAALMGRLDPLRYEIVCVSPRNYFLMTPLLPSVTVGTIEPRTTVESIRTLFPWVKFVEAECLEIDPKAKQIKVAGTGEASSSRVTKDSARARPEFKVAFDKLVVAVGAQNNTFGIPGVEQHAHFLKEITDARRIRCAISDAFESASNPGQTPEERRRLLNFVVVGGGPTGVETAAELADLLHEDLQRSFPALKNEVKIRLVEATESVLSMFDKRISEYTVDHFKREKIDVLLNMAVKEVKAKEVIVQAKGSQKLESLPCSVVVWATGIKSRPLVEGLRQAIGVNIQNNFRGLLTDDKLEVLGAPGVYALGDCATIAQKRASSAVSALYNEAKKDPKGKGITLESFRALMLSKAAEYPQLQFMSTSDAFEAEFKKADRNKDGVLTEDELKLALEQADRQLKVLPATAQVAAQEGKYLGRLLNSLPVPDHMETGGAVVQQLRGYWNQYLFPNGPTPFRYSHLGSLVFLGGESASIDLTGVDTMLTALGLNVSTGHGTFLLWRSFYLSEMFSTRTKLLLLFDWIRCRCFGRDISRY